MSFEGYFQYVCKEGHYWNSDCYIEHDICPQCHQKAVWDNLVDETNGSHDEDGKRIDGYVELETLCKTECEYCGSVLNETYKIPKNKNT